MIRESNQELPSLLSWRAPTATQVGTFAVSALFALIGVGFLFAYDIPGFGAIDLCQYWSAAVLALQGDNPYDPVLLSAVELAANPKSVGVRMWNPPVIIPLISWMAVLPFRWVVPIYFLCSILLLIFGVALAKSGRYRLSCWEWFYALTFPPALVSLWLGQGALLLLLGFLGFLGFIGADGKGRLTASAAAGAALSVTLVKPHALYLLYLLLLAASVRERRWATLAGFCVGAAVLVGLTAAINPQLFSWYAEAIKSPPIHFRTPTLGSWLQDVTGMIKLKIRLIPSVITVFLFAIWLLRQSAYSAASLFIVLPLSLVTSPYTWTYDQMVLLPFALRLIMLDRAAAGPHAATVLLITSNLFLLSLPFGPGLQFDVWYPAAPALAYLVVRRKALSLAPSR